MITDPVGIVAVLLFIEASIFLAASSPRFRKFFGVLPPMFWIYFLPICVSTAGILPQESGVYPFITQTFLPSAIILLLLSVDVRAIGRLGATALIMMAAGSFGILIGAPIVILLFKPFLPGNIWMGFGALSGSWIGGSANMIAIKEGIGTPEDLFLLMVIVDTIVSYSWMGILIACAGFQERFDRWNHADTRALARLEAAMLAEQQERSMPSVRDICLIVAVAVGGTFVSSVIAARLPEVKNLFSAFTWTILLVSIIGVLLSGTPARRLEGSGASAFGYVLLYLVLASIGARANLSQIAAAPVLILAGFVWILMHAGILVVTARFLKAPLFFVVVSSQANIGGTASAPVVAEVYRKGLAPVGVLMAILGLITGTFLGLLCSQLCRMVSG